TACAASARGAGRILTSPTSADRLSTPPSSPATRERRCSRPAREWHCGRANWSSRRPLSSAYGCRFRAVTDCRIVRSDLFLFWRALLIVQGAVEEVGQLCPSVK